jgi:hypothetical protein
MRDETNKANLALVFFANTQIQLELIDRLKGTQLYSQKLKNLCNQVEKENEKLISQLYGKMDDTIEPYFHMTVEMTETLMDIVEKGDIEVLIHLLKEYRDGNISVVDENKHGKILNQMDKLKI